MPVKSETNVIEDFYAELYELDCKIPDFEVVAKRVIGELRAKYGKMLREIESHAP